jgi:hypothetical protein
LTRRLPTRLRVCSHFRMARAPLLEAGRSVVPCARSYLSTALRAEWLCGEVTQYRLWREFEPKCGVALAPRLRKVGQAEGPGALPEVIEIPAALNCGGGWWF